MAYRVFFYKTPSIYYKLLPQVSILVSVHYKLEKKGLKYVKPLHTKKHTSTSLRYAISTQALALHIPNIIN